MLHLRVFGDAPTMEELVEALQALPGVGHVTRAETGVGAGRTLVTADLDPAVADTVLDLASRRGVPPEDVVLLRLTALHAGWQHGPHLVWADLLGQAGRYASPVARYLVFMAVAGTIAAYGVINDDDVLIVGAMALSPDLLPITGICAGLVAGRRRLARRDAVTLAAGLFAASLAAAALAFALEGVGLLPAHFEVGETSLADLSTVHTWTAVVAFAAGVAGMLALETRASAAVGVAISVTTIPASAYLGVAAGVGELGMASGALLVLGVNVAALVAGGSVTLIVQQWYERRTAARP